MRYFFLAIPILLGSGLLISMGADNGKLEPPLSIPPDSLTGRQSTSNLEQVPAEMATRSGLKLEAKTLVKFKEMRAEAKKVGIDLFVLSGYRSFADQKRIWDNKFTGKTKVAGKDLSTEKNPRNKILAILTYSSMPGTSRHHWGTDFDIAFSKNNQPDSLLNRSWETGKGKEAYTWLTQNASRFGFCQPYQGTPDKRNPGTFTYGYNEEKWHWSYKPVSRNFTNAYKDQMDNLKPSGFSGADTGTEFYEQFILNVDPDCLTKP